MVGLITQSLDSAVTRYCLLWASVTPFWFFFWELTSNFPVGHPSWECSRVNFFNFRDPMEPKASELLKCLVLYGGGHVHIRHITPSPLVDVGCYMYDSGLRRRRNIYIDILNYVL
ncbi:hypothetical protein DVH24_003387 [Malus domestica]|uniref:Uncharacterized protein n=1 Tax=Malus domestica TaxID=3750 RepID=A0A498IIE0_MALDO|nr:hypothetical protein DVH24_003387 [Malus domestica]